MNAIFIELPAFERRLNEYLDDEQSDLTPKQRAAFKKQIKLALEVRRTS